MSFSGIEQFRKNLDALMKSEAFKNADDGQRFRMGGALVNSKYGATGFSQTKELPTKKTKAI